MRASRPRRLLLALASLRVSLSRADAPCAACAAPPASSFFSVASSGAMAAAGTDARAPLFSFADVEIEHMRTGAKAPLSSLWADGKPAAISFLRRLG